MFLSLLRRLKHDHVLNNVGYNFRGFGVVRVWPLNLQSNIHALDDATKEIIRFGQLRGVIGERDEKLAAVGIRATVRHSDLALDIIAQHRLVFALIAWAAGASTQGIAALNNKARYHAMEFQPIIEVVLGQEDKVVDRHRRVLWIKLNDDQAAIGIDADTVECVRIDKHSRGIGIAM